MPPPITYDNSSIAGRSPIGGSITLSFSVGNNPNRYLIVGVATDNESSAAAASSATVNGTSMASLATNGNSGTTVSLFGLASPATGTVSVVVGGVTNGQNYVVTIYSYYNAVNGVDKFAADVGTGRSRIASVSFTPTYNYELVWAFGVVEPSSGGNINVGPNNTQGISGVCVGTDRFGAGDFGIINPASLQTASSTPFSSATGICMIALIPLLPDLVSVTDSTAITDMPSLQITKLNVNVSDSTALTDSVTIEENVTDVSLLGTLVTSAYKWLTSTLYAAQQNLSVRPYFTTHIFDDTIQPNAQYFSGTGNPASTNPNSSSATAPDGKIFSVAINAVGQLQVWSSSQLHAVAGVWDNVVTINTGAEVINDPRNVVSIKISDWLNSSYQIDVWYYANFINDGSNLQIKLQTSLDGGVTWSEINFTPSSFPNNSIGNLALAGMTPFMYTDGTMRDGCFYIKPNANALTFTGYDIYYIYKNTSSGYATDVIWKANVQSYDWTIHSLDTYYLKNIQYVVFSGFRNVLDGADMNQNFSLWITRLLNTPTAGVTDLWTSPVNILPIGAPAPTNLNSFTYPSAQVITANNQTLVYVTCNATLVDSIGTTSIGISATVVTTHTNYMLLTSDDGKSFSYPSVLVGTDGTEFNNGAYCNFVNQGNYYYAIGAGFLWEYYQSNVTADVTQDVIGYQIQESAGQPSSINLQIGNASNKWSGNAPTAPGASAIAGNRKILLWQGYYNKQGSPEAVPRNIYYIDDVEQTVSGNDNSLTVIGRDWYKKLITTITKFTYTFIGPIFFTDIFDGTFQSQYNQISGTWSFVNAFDPPVLQLTNAPGTIVLSYPNGNSYGHFFRIFFRSVTTTGAFVYIYALYIDSNNWLALQLNCQDGQSWAVVDSVNGVQTTLDSGTMPFTMGGSKYYGIYIRRYGYYKFNFMIDSYGDPAGNVIQDYAPTPSTNSFLFANMGSGEYDLSSVFASQSYWQKPFTVGFGSNANGPNNFRWLSYVQYNIPNDLASVVKSVARISGIFAFKISNFFRDYLYVPLFSGTSFTIQNRRLTLTQGGQALSINNNPFGDGEISFMAKITIGNYSSNAGFSFIFRSGIDDETNENDNYNFHIFTRETSNPNPPVQGRFERYIQAFAGTTYNFYNSPFDVTYNPSSIGSLNINLEQWHKYRIFMVGGWFYAYIDDQMVAAWNDNNTTVQYVAQGQWGFSADANTTLQVQQIEAPNFWKPVQSFSINPGDDMQSDIESLIQSLRAWIFSDLFGRFKLLFLNPNDTSTYTYDNQLYQQNTDLSDKEYVAQVTVYGTGVSATARNTSLFAGAITRDMVIVDYTILTQADAQTRANNELINANQYQNQYTPSQVINVGSELFDAVTIVNTGNNTSGVNGPTRTYAETFTDGGGTNQTDYSVQLDTGNL